MSGTPRRSLSCADYTVACICSMGLELAPVTAMLDQIDQDLPTLRDQNAYTLGRVGHHNIVVAAMPGIGNNNAATVATQLVNDFPSIRFALLVGVGSAVPGEEEENDIRLGDVVVSEPTGVLSGVIQYDLGKALTDSRFARVGQLDKPPAVLSANVRKLQAQHLMSGDRISHYLSDMLKRYPLMSRTYSFPSTLADQLFLASYTHRPGKTCRDCDSSQVVNRPERLNSAPQLHYGTIGSANMVVKDPVLRDSLRNDMNVLCVETEAAGLIESFPCLVIRGICDYADSHKNEEWQPYAAAAAAAYMKELLTTIPPQQVLKQQFAKDLMVTDYRTHELLKKTNKLYQESSAIQFELSVKSDLRYKTEREHQCHQIFKTSPYEQFKNNNPDRIEGTCRWVLEHDQFRAWQQSDCHDLLWISADPGCGKSVLVKSLIDVEYSGKRNLNICYFFFKDNGNQDDLATALCAVLHQLFTQQPTLLRHAMSVYEQVGEAVRQERDKMWQVLLAATTDPSAKPTLCFLDALDECREHDRAYLIDELCKFYKRQSYITPAAPFKCLVTSRPYDDVRRWFTQPPADMRRIWLRGEQENDQINEEINLVIDKHINDLNSEFSLSKREQEDLTLSLRQMKHRTYLWLYLSIEDIRATCRDRLFSDEMHFDHLPRSVEEAYERILNKVDSKQESKARMILSIILGAKRPLTITEMALALGAVRAHEIDQAVVDLVEIKDLGTQIRNLCGLFVFVNHSQLFLIHQTAKEFLLTESPCTSVPNHRWGSSFQRKEIETKMAVLCATSLCLGRKYTRGQEDFFRYCAEHWVSHLTNGMLSEDSRLLQKAASLYDKADKLSSWLSIMWQASPELSSHTRRGVGSQHAIAINGHTLVLAKLHSMYNYDLNARDGTDRTPLLWAIERNHDGVARWLLQSGVRVNTKAQSHGSPLQVAASHGREEIARMLLEQGVWINACRGNSGNALYLASVHGHEAVVELLLEYGADPNVRGLSCSALAAAVQRGHLETVLVLLRGGADVDLGNDYEYIPHITNMLGMSRKYWPRP